MENKFNFKTTFAFFTIEKAENGVNVLYNDKVVFNLPETYIWDKDGILRGIQKNKCAIIEGINSVNNNEKLVEQLKKENKELKEQLSSVKVNICGANVESVFNQCIDYMTEVYDEKKFISCRAKQIMNKYNEHK